MRSSTFSSILCAWGLVLSCSGDGAHGGTGNGTDAGSGGSAAGGSAGATAGHSGGAPGSGGGGVGTGGAGNGGGNGTGGASGGGNDTGGSPPDAGTDHGSGTDSGADAGSTTVVGTVLSGAAPTPGIAVLIDGKAMVTDANGEFTATGVGATYDAAVIGQGTPTRVTVFRGLSTRTPALPSGLADRYSATVSGQVSGSVTFPNSASQRVGVACLGKDLLFGSAILGDTKGPGYGPIALTWYYTAATDSTLVGLAWTVDGAGLPTAYTGFATKPLTLSDGGSFGLSNGTTPATNLVLGAVTDRSLSGTITVPSGLAIDEKAVRVGLVRGIEMVTDVSTATSYAYRVPTGLSSVLTTLHVFASDASGGGAAHTLVVVPDSASTKNVTLLAPPLQVLPIDAATAVDTSTTFAFTAPVGTVRGVEFADQAGTLVVDVYTTGQNVTFPDLSGAGIALQKGGTYTWSVSADDIAATVDDFLAPAIPRLLARGSHGDSSTATRTFVAKP